MKGQLLLSCVSVAVGGMIGEVVAYPGYAGPAKIVLGYPAWPQPRSIIRVDKSSRNDGSTWVTLSADLFNVEDGCTEGANFTSGSCTVAIHEGHTCSNASAIGGHLYDVATYPSSEDDPWGHGMPYYHSAKFPATDGEGKPLSQLLGIIDYQTSGPELARCHLTPKECRKGCAYSGFLSGGCFEWHGVAVVKDHAGVRAACAEMEWDPVPPECTAWNKDPYATGAHVSCCDGLQEGLGNWDGDGNIYYKCRQATISMAVVV